MTGVLGEDGGVDGIYEDFGRRVRRAREAAKLTQEGLARRVGLKRTSITNIEKGSQHVPLHMLFRLANALGKPPADLLPGPEAAIPADAVRLQLTREFTEDDTQWARRVIAEGTGSDEEGADGEEKG